MGDLEQKLQRAPIPLRYSYPVVRLYQDDAEELIQLLRSNCERVRVEAGGYVIQELADLKKLGLRRIHDFDVTGLAGAEYLYIRLTRRSAHLSLSRDDDTALRGTAAQADTILRRRAPFLQALLAPRSGWTVTALVTVNACAIVAMSLSGLSQFIHATASGHSISLGVRGFVPSDIFELPFNTFVLMYFVAAINITTWARSVVYLSRPSERSSFWERNRDQLLVGIIAAIVAGLIVGLLSFVGGYLLGAGR